MTSVHAGDGRDSPLKYTAALQALALSAAGDGRDSPLKYTAVDHGHDAQLSLGMAGIHRSSTLC